MAFQALTERTDGHRKHPLKLRMRLRKRCELCQRSEEDRRPELLRKFDSLLPSAPSAATFDLLSIHERRTLAHANSLSELRQSSGEEFTLREVKVRDVAQ